MSRRSTKARRSARRREEAIFQAQFGREYVETIDLREWMLQTVPPSGAWPKEWLEDVRLVSWLN